MGLFCVTELIIFPPFSYSLPYAKLPPFWILHVEQSAGLKCTSNWQRKYIFCSLPLANKMNSWGLGYCMCSVPFSQELNPRHMQNVSVKKKKTEEAKLLVFPPLYQEGVIWNLG